MTMAVHTHTSFVRLSSINELWEGNDKARIHLLAIYSPCGIFNHLNSELNPICHPLALLGAHHILHVSRIRVKDSPREKDGRTVTTTVVELTSYGNVIYQI